RLPSAVGLARSCPWQGRASKLLTAALLRRRCVGAVLLRVRPEYLHHRSDDKVTRWRILARLCTLHGVGVERSVLRRTILRRQAVRREVRVLGVSRRNQKRQTNAHAGVL